MKPQRDGGWEVITDKGSIRAEHVVNAAGLWAREVGEMAGVQLPLLPVEHHYLISGGLPGLQDRSRELPTIVDLDGEMYLRQEQSGVLLGVYETPATPWAVDGTPWDFGENDLLPKILSGCTVRWEKALPASPRLPTRVSSGWSTALLHSRRTAIPWWVRYLELITTGSPAVSWPVLPRAAASASRWPSG